MAAPDFAFAVRETVCGGAAKRPQDGYRAHRNAINSACYSAAKPRPRDDQGYLVVDGTDKERIIDGDWEWHGLFRAGAFQAASIRRPSIEYSGVVRPQARIVGHLTCRGLVKFRPHCGFLLA